MPAATLAVGTTAEPMHARVLFLTHEPPLPLVSGARLRSFYLMRELARAGHKISLFAIVANDGPDSGDRQQLEDMCEHVELWPFRVSKAARLSRLAVDYTLRRPFERRYFYRRDAAQSLERLVEQGRFDAFIVGQLYMEAYLPHAVSAHTIFDSHNVEARRIATMTQMDGPRAWMARRQLQPVTAHEGAVVQRVARTWAVSAVEHEYFERFAPDRVDLVPNGVDCAALPFRASPASGTEVLFLGRMDYGPNIDGARYLMEDVVPRLDRRDAYVRIVGANPPAEIRRLAEKSAVRMEVTGFVPDTAPFVESARVLAVSLRAGGGTRLKILEALARGVPVVTTTLGCEGLGLTHGKEVLIADDPSDFAQSLDLLLADDPLCASLARNGREAVTRQFDWSAIGEAAESSLERLLAR